MDVNVETTGGFHMRQKNVWKVIAHIGGMVNADMLLKSADLENTTILQITKTYCVSGKKIKKKKKKVKIKLNDMKRNE